jgi:hypothetical protein
MAPLESLVVSEKTSSAAGMTDGSPMALEARVGVNRSQLTRIDHPAEQIVDAEVLELALRA